MRTLPPLTQAEIEADDTIEVAPEWGCYGKPQPEDILSAVDRLLERHGLELVQHIHDGTHNERLLLKVEKRAKGPTYG